MKRNKSIKDLLIEFFKKHPNEDMSHGPVVDWVEDQYKKLYNKKPRDTWRSIRNLHESGFLIKVRKGIYKYNPAIVKVRKLQDFTPQQKEEIKKRDGYKCVVCGKSEKDGVELHIDHIDSRYGGGEASIDNGMTLCGPHNYWKKNLGQTESAKKMFSEASPP